jgi:hypothetical protein
MVTTISPDSFIIDPPIIIDTCVYEVPAAIQYISSLEMYSL